LEINTQKGDSEMEKLFDSCLYIMTNELDNPGLWSHEMAEKTLERTEGMPYDTERVRLVIKNYLGVLRDALREA
jgi:hypothetical protein